MRRLLVALVVLALAVGGAGIADVAISGQVERAIAAKIERQVPGSQAQVTITSFPFVGRLALAGNVPRLAAQVTNVTEGPVTLDSVDVVVDDVSVVRRQLLGGQVQLRSIRRATVTAVMSQASLDRQVGLPVTLGAGTVGLSGMQVAATLSVTGDRIRIQVPPLPAISLTIPLTNLLPCIGQASLQPGRLVLACTTDRLPPVLANLATSF